MPINRITFFADVRILFGGRYTQAQVAGLSAVLDEWEQRLSDGDLRWLAYMLATAFHETARTMQPVREAFWLTEEWRRQNLRYYPFYGRGYVQLTWRENYEKAGEYVGANLAANPDLALRPDFAAAIMFVGMREGWFRADRNGRRQTLARYFGHGVDDPVGAREIINGAEWKTASGRKVLVAEIIARYHRSFLNALRVEPAELAPVRSGVSTLDEEERGLASATYNAFAGEVSERYLAETAAAVSGTPAESAEHLLRYTVEIVTGYVSNNTIQPGEVPEFIRSIHVALQQASAAPDFGDQSQPNEAGTFDGRRAVVRPNDLADAEPVEGSSAETGESRQPQRRRPRRGVGTKARATAT